MTCRDFADFLGMYLAGELPAGVLARFEGHIAVCPNCERYVGEYRATIALGRAAFTEPGAVVPAAVPGELVAAILAARTRR